MASILMAAEGRAKLWITSSEVISSWMLLFSGSSRVSWVSSSRRENQDWSPALSRAGWARFPSTSRARSSEAVAPSASSSSRGR